MRNASEGRISVCMAVYNGAQYIREQVASILPQLGLDDEIVAVDDASLDTSVAVLEEFHDHRIRIIRQEHNCGVLRTFERALLEASGEIIFLADQDDIWREDKVATMMRAFISDLGVTLVLSNGEMIDSNGWLLSQELKSSGRFYPGVLANLIKNRYQGSTMAFRREVLEAVLPFPDGIPMHDSWIGLVNAVVGRVVYLPAKLLFYRRHSGNVTASGHGPMLRMVGQRWRIILSLVFRLKAMMRVKRSWCEQERSIAFAGVAKKSEMGSKEKGYQNRAVVFAPFFLVGGPASRSSFVASVLAKFLRVDVVSSDFDHTRKVKTEHRQYQQFDKVVYLQTHPYRSNVGVARFISHLLFGFKAAAYFRKNRTKYDVVYVNAPLNLMALLVFWLAGTRTKIIDVGDIWPDVLPFSSKVRRLLAPCLAVWKWCLKAAVARADVVMAVSDRFINEISTYAKHTAKVKRFYIGNKLLSSTVAKQTVFTIAYVGNIGRLYDFDTLVDVLSEDGIREHTQLFIVGKGDREEWLIRELEQRKILYRFFGIVLNPQRLSEILRSCHVGFNGYSNTTTAFSYKATTYFAAGLPLINSMTGDLRYLVEKYGLGENYEGGNREQLRECLIRLWRNGTTTMATNSERFFASQVDASKIAAEMEQFLKESCKPKHFVSMEDVARS